MYEGWGAGKYSISLADAQTGVRTFLTSVDTGGFGSIRFSPDGAWLLVSSTLVDVASGRAVRPDALFNVSGPIDSWPALGASALLVLHQLGCVVDGSGPSRLLAFDLAHNDVEDLGPIELPDEPGPTSRLCGLSDVAVSPDGRIALCGSKFGIGGELPYVTVAQDRLSLLDLETRRVELLAEPFIDVEGVKVEREQGGFHWLGRHPATNTRVADELLARLAGPMDERDENGFDRIAQNARDLLVLGLNLMIGDGASGSRPEAVMTEVLRALVAITRYAPHAHIEELRWVEQVAEAVPKRALAGTFSPPTADAWLRFIEAWERIKDPSQGPVGWPGVLA